MTKLTCKNFKELMDDHKEWLKNPKPFNCACCEKRHCDKKGKVIPENERVRKQWKACCEENICPQCGPKQLASFWLRGDMIECSDCR